MSLYRAASFKIVASKLAKYNIHVVVGQ